MPQYELVLIVKTMARPQLSKVVKRTCEQIWSTGGIVRKMSDLGLRSLPYKMKTAEEIHRQGNYFLLDFDTSPVNVPGLNQSFRQDLEIIRPTIVKKDGGLLRPCSAGPCEFGEIKNPDYEMKTWRRRAQKQLWKARKKSS